MYSIFARKKENIMKVAHLFQDKGLVASEFKWPGESLEVCVCIHSQTLT